MTEEEAISVKEVVAVALHALETCREGYDHEGGSYQYFDEDKVQQAKTMLRNVRMFEK